MKKLHLLWMLIPSYIFFAIAFNNRPDVPIYDSYNAILGTIIDWKKFSGWDRLWLLFRQHNEHRLFPSRVFYLAYYYLTGGVNFTIITFLGDLQMFGIALGGLYFVKRATPKYWLAAGFVWVIFIFDLNGYSNSVVQMQAVANWGVIFTTIAAMVCFDKGWCWPGAILQFLTIFSNGNGVPAAIIVAVFVANGVEWYKVKYAAIPILLAPLYYIHFVPNDYEIDLGKSAVFFICSLGAPFSFDYALPWGLLVFGVLLFCFPYKTFWKDKVMFPMLCILAFALVSMLMAAVFRGAASDSQYQASRYLIYPQMTLATVFLLLIRKVKKPVTAIAICLPIFILAWSMNCQFGKAMFEVEANRCTLYQGKYRFYYPPVRMQEAIDISREADSLGIYSIDDHR